MSVNTEPGMYLQKPLDNSTLVLVLGIISVFGYFTYILPGFVFSIAALILSKKANTLYKVNPNLYTRSSLSNLRAGKIIAIAGLSIVGVIAFFLIAYMFLYSLPGGLKD